MSEIYFISNAVTIDPSFKTCTIDDVAEYCSDKLILGVDTETTGLNFVRDHMIMFQIGDKDVQFVIDTRYISIEPLKFILESKSITKIFHNAKFDYKFIRKHNIVTENVYDTMLAEKVLTCGTDASASLANVFKKYFNKEMQKDERNSFIGFSSSPFTNSQILYGAKDIEHLIDIREKQLELIEENSLYSVVELENEAVLAFGDIEYNGLKLDKKAWLELSTKTKKESEDLQKELDDIVLRTPKLHKFKSKGVQTDMFTSFDDLRKVDINWKSPKQVLRVLQNIVPKLDNVNGKAMYKYRKHELINKYITYKEFDKKVSSYGKDFFKYIEDDGLIHTEFNQILNTGRVSSSKPNMQQIPGTNEYRNCFIPPRGHVFVSSDYSSQELNVIAFGSKDPVWLAALERGEDLHSVCADLVYKKKWEEAAEEDCSYMKSKSKCNCPGHGKLRKNVKSINFGLAYGMGPQKLSDDLNIPLADAKDLISEYFVAFPSIENFLSKLGNYGKRFGYIKTFPPFRRRRWFPEWFQGIQREPSLKGELGKIERASKNTPIQGASADMTKLAMVLIRREIIDEQLPVKMVMTVHDQIDTITTKEYAKEWKVRMTELMEEAALGIVTNGLLKADTNISLKWEK